MVMTTVWSVIPSGIPRPRWKRWSLLGAARLENEKPLRFGARRSQAQRIERFVTMMLLDKGRVSIVDQKDDRTGQLKRKLSHLGQVVTMKNENAWKIE